MIGPGRDTNYPTSSGSAITALLSQQFAFSGMHVTVGMILVVLVLLLIWKGKR